MKPNPKKEKLHLILYAMISGALLWLLLIVLAPIFKASNVNILNYFSEYVYFLFEPACHQLPERSIYLNSEPMAVCTRCFAIYFGAFIFLVFFMVRKRIYHINPSLVIIFSVPTIIDFILEKFGWYADIPLLRFLTGLLFGASILYLVLYSIMDIKNEHINKWKFNYGKSEIN